MQPWALVSALLRSLLARRLGGHFSEMPNIKQQKKRVRVAARERFENLRYRSTIKTLTRRLEYWLDLAAVRGAIHKNKAARRKSQVARLVSGTTPVEPVAAKRGRRRHS